MSVLEKYLCACDRVSGRLIIYLLSRYFFWRAFADRWENYTSLYLEQLFLQRGGEAITEEIAKHQRQTPHAAARVVV